MSRAQVTRERLQNEAIKLFGERGYDNVTVEEIARAAGVSHMTFFRHFPTKESVVLDDPYDPLIGAAVANQDPGLAPLERVCRGLLDAWALVDAPDDESMRTRTRLAAQHPSLRARIWEYNHRSEQAIVAALVDGGAGPLESKVAAGGALGALTAALLDWAEHEGSDTLGDRVRAALLMLMPGNVGAR